MWNNIFSLPFFFPFSPPFFFRTLSTACAQRRPGHPLHCTPPSPCRASIAFPESMPQQLRHYPSGGLATTNDSVDPPLKARSYSRRPTTPVTSPSAPLPRQAIVSSSLQHHHSRNQRRANHARGRMGKHACHYRARRAFPGSLLLPLPIKADVTLLHHRTKPQTYTLACCRGCLSTS